MAICDLWGNQSARSFAAHFGKSVVSAQNHSSKNGTGSDESEQCCHTPSELRQNVRNQQRSRWRAWDKVFYRKVKVWKCCHWQHQPQKAGHAPLVPALGAPQENVHQYERTHSGRYRRPSHGVVSNPEFPEDGQTESYGEKPESQAAIA